MSLRADPETLTCPDCVYRPWPTPAPTIEPIPLAYQPPPSQGHTLEWRRYMPDSGIWGPGPWPTVVLLHEGEFSGGSPFGQAIQYVVAPELQAAGYYVLVPSWRLAPCGLITNQHCHDNTSLGIKSGRPPQQSDDAKAIIQAARDDVNCLNRKVGVVGGSAGATHAVWVALDTNSTPGGAWPFWTVNGTTDDRADVVCCLSGAYLFSDRTVENYTPSIDFAGIIHNYTGTTDPVVQTSLSPTTLVKSPSEFSFKPIFLINTERDSMPYNQIIDMRDALHAKGIFEPAFQLITIPHSSEHAYEYWSSSDGQVPNPLPVSTDVKAYLKAVIGPFP